MTDVVVDSQGDIVVSGLFAGTLSFGEATLSSADPMSFDTYIAKFGTAGELAWLHGFGDAGKDHTLGLALTPDDGVVAAGWFDGTFPTSVGTLTAPAAPGQMPPPSDGFVLTLGRIARTKGLSHTIVSCQNALLRDLEGGRM